MKSKTYLRALEYFGSLSSTSVGAGDKGALPAEGAGNIRSEFRFLNSDKKGEKKKHSKRRDTDGLTRRSSRVLLRVSRS